jgi:hypothetical protein
LAIYTVPPGLKVYISPDTEAAPPAKRDTDKGTPVVEKHAALDQAHFKGVTPLTVAIPPGRYLVAVAPIMLFDAHYQMGAIDHSHTARALVSFEPLSNPASFEDGLMGAAIYEVTRDTSADQGLLLLACGWDTPLEALEAAYPPEPTFSFDDQQLRKELLEAKLPEPHLERVILLLRRGGRAWVVRGDLGWWVSLKPGSKWTIDTKVRARE